ncbi:AMP-dependent synthetase and ligase [Alcanivorax balearicus MACL04]|uniref:AMP-dependent synthetase and ligase n=1 Tax=Alloalcanivorax balearicus MACL04 TaxID=1177182 RepID=A0ABT2R328_9GAMM|nr:long-chain fatty acid--CoA ligase [Alloalcanivorax balearicus]MCU5784169.1 AMP-dependent synthetase and ligase [Alloalcanivorax balearicus MACL04]
MSQPSFFSTHQDVHYLGGVGDWITHHATQDPQRMALVFGDLRLTYSELNQRINRLANALTDLGVAKGDRVALLMLNGNHFIESFFACAKLGAIALPLNYRLSAEEIGFILGDAGATVLLYQPALADLFRSIRQNTALHHGIATEGEAEPGDHRYDALLDAAPASEPGVPLNQNDPLMMMYTSGTTGKPKGALLSHGNPTWLTADTIASDAAISRDSVILTIAPLFHIGGLAVHTLPALNIGAQVVLHAQFDPRHTLATVQKERITELFLLPAMWQALSQSPNINDYDLSSLRSLLSGGAPCPIPVIEFFQERGLAFQEGFGMTETCAGACILGSADAVRKNGSVGKPLVYVQMRIVDENDQDVATGEVGELILRGPTMFLGYWGRPDATEEACRNGWFHSGDLARRDEEGFYYIVDRKKDMLISGGENVYPTEVEQVLYKHEQVLEVAVIGVPDDKWGEVPMAVVVPRDGQTPTLESLRDFCDGKLGRFKIPKHLALVDELPRNATGKILKRTLRDRFTGA